MKKLKEENKKNELLNIERHAAFVKNLSKKPGVQEPIDKMKSAKQVFDEGYQDFINKSLSDYEKQDGKIRVLSPNTQSSSKKVVINKKDSLEPL